ncbi:hypothetical protein OIU77_014473, partial [Salix suchowensis]
MTLYFLSFRMCKTLHRE